jgi:hypothetical protein
MYSVKASIFNNMLVRNVHLTKGQAYSHQRGCYVRTITIIAQLKKVSGRESQAA